MNINRKKRVIGKRIGEVATEFKRTSLFPQRCAYVIILFFLLFFSSKTFAKGNDCNLFQSANKEKAAFRWDDALAKYKQLVKEYPTSPFAAKTHIQLGLSLKYQKRYDEAIAQYEQAIAKCYEGRVAEDAKTAIAAVYYFNGDFLKALGLFRQVLSKTKDWDQVKYCSHFIREIKRRISVGNYSMSQCGPEALAKICEISNIKTSPQELARLMELTNQGASLEDLRKCAESKGLKATGVKLTAEQLRTVKLPLIALLEPTHYVVVTELSEQESVEIIDPGKRNVSLTLSSEEFQKYWSGLALVFDSEEKLTPTVVLLDRNIMKTSRGKICDCCPEGNEGGPEDNKNTEFEEEPPCGPGMPRIMVNTVTLNMVLEDTDFSYDGRGPRVETKRTYNADSPKSSIFGNSWTFNYNTWLWEAPDKSVYLTRGSGKIDRFIYAGSYIPPEGVYDNLTKNQDGTWSLKMKKGKTTHHFNAFGTLTSISDQNGNMITLQHSKNPVLNPSLIWGTNNYSGDGEFDGPSGIATDTSGFVYVVDSGNNRIQKFDSNGNLITKWGSYGDGDGEFNEPSGIATDASGFVYVAETAEDTGDPRIQKFDSNGNFITKWGSYGDGDGEFNEPSGIATDTSGFVYVADSGNNRIQKFDSNGGFITKWESFVSDPWGVTTDDAGFVYVVNLGDSNIVKFDSKGNFITQWGQSGSSDGNFRNPVGITIDDNGGYVYVADTGNKRIQKFSNIGNYVTKWGSDTSGDGILNLPVDTAIDNLGNIYVVEGWNDRIQKFDSNGNFITKWGSYGDGNGEFNGPSGIATDTSGFVYEIENK